MRLKSIRNSLQPHPRSLPFRLCLAPPFCLQLFSFLMETQYLFRRRLECRNINIFGRIESVAGHLTGIVTPVPDFIFQAKRLAFPKETRAKPLFERRASGD